MSLCSYVKKRICPYVLMSLKNCLSVILSLIIFLSLSACNAEDAVYREYRCYFLFDTQLHPIPCQLTGIIGNPGHFCKVEAGLDKGIRHIKTTRNYDDATEDVPLTTDRENQQSCVLGANNCIIIGTSSYDNVLIAYEGQCANCLEQYGGTRYPLSWQNNGTLLHCNSYLRCQQRHRRQRRRWPSALPLPGCLRRSVHPRLELTNHKSN